MAQWPSAELKPLSPRRARIMAVLWWLLFALAVVAILGGIWRSVEQNRHPDGFDRTGLQASTLGGDCVTVVPASHRAHVDWPDDIDSDLGGCIVSVDGQPVSLTTPREGLAKLLDGPPGTQVELTLKDDHGKLARARFHRSAMGDWFEITQFVAYTLVTILFAGVAFLLRRRQPNDRVSMRMSFVFLMLLHACDNAVLFWAWIADAVVGQLLGGIALMLLITTLPAFPDGIYVPRAARWVRLIVPLMVVAGILVQAVVQVDWFTPAMLGMLGLGVGLLVLRYFRMPAGLEKQKVKWTVFGLSVGLLVLLLLEVAPTPSALSDTNPTAFDLVLKAFELVTVLGVGMIPAGVGVSLLEYRLNDADAAAGKSLGYAIVTLVVGVAWAVVQSVVGDAARHWASNPKATVAITTVVAALVFTPTKNYVLSWTEAKFQPALVRLRKLPEKLVRWQTCQTPDELAAATLADLVNGVGAAYAAIIGDDGREWRMLAANGIDPDKAMAQLSAERPADAREDPFPIRRELADQLGKPDILAVGPRSDGASYTSDEKAAIAMIVEPLSNAIQAAALRERHILKVENSLTGIDHRLARLETEIAPLAGEAASRPSPKGS